jgi:hypothetical protein
MKGIAPLQGEIIVKNTLKLIKKKNFSRNSEPNQSKSVQIILG